MNRAIRAEKGGWSCAVCLALRRRVRHGVSWRTHALWPWVFWRAHGAIGAPQKQVLILAGAMEGHSVDNVGVMDRPAPGDGLGDQLLQLFSHGDTWTTSACS
jgi:hypothetical protein